MFNKTLIIALACLSLTVGCGFTKEGDLARTAVSEGGAQAMDEGLVNAEWFICNAASIGAVKRRYGRTKEQADSYNALCGLEGDAAIVTGVPEGTVPE